MLVDIVVYCFRLFVIIKSSVSPPRYTSIIDRLPATRNLSDLKDSPGFFFSISRTNSPISKAYVTTLFGAYLKTVFLKLAMVSVIC